MTMLVIVLFTIFVLIPSVLKLFKKIFNKAYYYVASYVFIASTVWAMHLLYISLIA